MKDLIGGSELGGAWGCLEAGARESRGGGMEEGEEGRMKFG